jgi:N-acyl-D-amino-acid deacylase
VSADLVLLSSFPKRGVLREGAFADVVVFDRGAILDRATLEEPRVPPRGVTLVLVNGKAAYRNGALTGALPGVALQRQQI